MINVFVSLVVSLFPKKKKGEEGGEQTGKGLHQMNYNSYSS